MTLTIEQKRIVSEMKDGCELVRCFDVWGGYWWILRSPAGQEKVRKYTVEALEKAKAIKALENKRVYSGYQEMQYELLSSRE